MSVGAARAKAFQEVVTPEAPHLFRRWALQDLRSQARRAADGVGAAASCDAKPRFDAV